MFLGTCSWTRDVSIKDKWVLKYITRVSTRMLKDAKSQTQTVGNVYSAIVPSTNPSECVHSHLIIIPTGTHAIIAQP